MRATDGGEGDVEQLVGHDPVVVEVGARRLRGHAEEDRGAAAAAEGDAAHGAVVSRVGRLDDDERVGSGEHSVVVGDALERAAYAGAEGVVADGEVTGDEGEIERGWPTAKWRMSAAAKTETGMV